MASDELPPLGEDHFRLLALLGCYSGPDAAGGGGRWLKELAFQVAVFDLIRAGVFAHYDFAPTLIACHGTRRFAQTSQEAFNDLRYLRKRRLVDRVRVSTCYHDITGALRLATEGLAALASAPRDLRLAVRDRLACPRCGAVREPIVMGRGAAGSGSGSGDAAVAAARGPEAAWLCPACCARCRAAGRARPVDPRQCAECRLSLVAIPFFEVEPIAFTTKPHFPEHARGARAGGRGAGAESAPARAAPGATPARSPAAPPSPAVPGDGEGKR